MILAIDIGNSNICAAVMQGAKKVASTRIRTYAEGSVSAYLDEVSRFLSKNGIRPSDVRETAISSVVPCVCRTLTEACEELFGKKPLSVSRKDPEVPTLALHSPERLGKDILLGAIAARAEYPLPMLIIDIGTATTVCAIDETDTLIGYMIIPGPYTSVNALSAKAAQLPEIELDRPDSIFGKDTVSAMQSGILYGSACALDGIIDRMEEEMQPAAPLTLIATGGPAEAIIPLCRHTIIRDDDLLLKGLSRIASR